MAETPGQDPRRFGLHDFLPALKSGVLVGGQAVNLWAEVYRARVPEQLEPLAPFVSKDCDLPFRTRHEPESLAREVGWRFVATAGVGQILGRLSNEAGAWRAHSSNVIPWDRLTATDDAALRRFAQHQRPA